MKHGSTYGDVALGVECALPSAHQAPPQAGRRPRAFARLAGRIRRLAQRLNCCLPTGAQNR